MVRARTDLPRRATRQLVSHRSDRTVGLRDRARGGRRRAPDVPISTLGRHRLRRGRDDAGRDDAGRHRDRGASRRRAVSRPRREDGAASVRRTRPADRRRRCGRSGLRHRRREGHPRARPHRLRDRAARRAPAAEHPRRGGAHQRERGRGVLRARSVRRAAGGARGAREAGSPRGGGAPLPPLGRPLLPMPQRDRAVDVGTPVVRRGGRAEGPGDRGGRGRADHLLARALAEGLRELAGRSARLEHLATALVGTPDPRVVLPGRTCHGGARGPGRVCHLRRRRDRAGPRRPRHVVLFAALAVLDARLARRDDGARGLLSERGARDRLRDPLPVGRADDHVGDVARRRHPVPRRGDPRAGS